MDTVEQATAEAFAGGAIGEASAAMTACRCGLGDRLGLFRELAAQGDRPQAQSWRTGPG